MKILILSLFIFCLSMANMLDLQAIEINNSITNNYLIADRNKDNCEMISSNDAIQKARQKVNGKVVSVKLDKNGSKSVYRVRILVDDKRIKNLTIKACK